VSVPDGSSRGTATAGRASRSGLYVAPATSCRQAPGGTRSRSVDQGRGVKTGLTFTGQRFTTPPAGIENIPRDGVRQNRLMASYVVNERAVARARRLIRGRQYVLNSDWGDVQPNAEDENAFLASHSWSEYGEWHLGLTEGASEETKARYAFVYGDFRRLHRVGLIACHYRAAEWRHKEIELAAHDLLQLLDRSSS
jgi:hypothetical protein